MTQGTQPKYLRYSLRDTTGKEVAGRDPHCKNSHHIHYVPDAEASAYERACRSDPEGED